MTLDLENMSLTASTFCMTGELGSNECSHSAAHESHKPTTNTPEDGADLRSVSQNTRKKFRSSTCHHIDAEKEHPKSFHCELSQLRALNAMFATVAAASVAVDGTNTASRHNLCSEQGASESDCAGHNATQSPR